MDEDIDGFEGFQEQDNYVGPFDYDTIKSGLSIINPEYADFFDKVQNEPVIPEHIMRVILITLFVVSLIGNSLVCYVIVRNQHMHTNTNFYLISLAVADILTSTSYVYGVLYSKHSNLNKSPAKIHIYLIKIFHWSASSVSILTIVAITVDRYIALCHPFLACSLINKPRTVRIIISLWAFVVPFTAIYIDCTCSLRKFCERFHIVHNPESYTTVFFLIPLIILLVLYALIGLTIQRSSRIHKHTICQRSQGIISQSIRNGINVSAAVVVEFCVTWGPINVILFLHKHNIIKKSQPGRTVMFFLGQAFYLLSTVANPILYNMTSSTFRTAFKDLLTPSCKGCCGRCSDFNVERGLELQSPE